VPRVLVVGSGGREHALAWRLAQTEGVEVHAAPGNPGIAHLGECHPVRAHDGEGLLGLARQLGADLVVIGPEAPLVMGVADELRHAGIAVFGPSAAAARIEGSKSFAKEVMRASGVPTPESLSVARPPCVVKLDGLAAGKGVFVCRTGAELDAGLKAASRSGGQVVIEELLEGDEVSVFALCDGSRALPLAPARDFKRLAEGDVGPNTGGMGSYSPVPAVDQQRARELAAAVHQPIVDELRRRGTPFHGVLYAGLMMGANGEPKVLEYNARFGDPETQAVLPRLRSDLLELLEASTRPGGLAGVEPEWTEDWAVTVVLASRGYPESSSSGDVISGLDDVESAEVFHAGTAERDGEIVTAGGRVLNVTGLGATPGDARDHAYAAAGKIDFDGRQMRLDIAERAVDRVRA
jgi:phosphoribosylamine--glycine ligase